MRGSLHSGHEIQSFCVSCLELSLFCFGSLDPYFNLQICVPSDSVATGHVGLLST